MAEVLIVASSFDQGLVNFRHILHFLKPDIETEPKRWRIQDSANRATITNRQTGAAPGSGFRSPQAARGGP